MMDDRLMGFSEVQGKTGNRSRRTYYRWISQGLFPAPISIGPNSVAWLESSIKEFIESKKQAAAQ